jgi:AAA+ superfamily predicted ATPase
VRLTAAEQERFTATVDFPLPEASERAELWRRGFAPIPGVSDGEVEFLARSFRLSGGSIEACCRTARRSAAEAGRSIRRSDIAAALEVAYANWVISPQTRAALDALRTDPPAPRPAEAAPTDGGPQASRPRRLPWGRRRDR